MYREQLPPSGIISARGDIAIPISQQQIDILTKKDVLPPKTLGLSGAQTEIGEKRLDVQMDSLNQRYGTVDFARSDYDSVKSFFDEAAVDYDSDLRNPYFSFSHDILKHILKTHINTHFTGSSNIRMLDAGAGTGNWSKYVLELNESIQGTLLDMNPNMLRVARKKLGNLTGKTVSIMEGNLEVMSDYPEEKSDLILCMHNVIGMGRNTPRILSNLYEHLTNHGLAFIMTSNKYQAFEFVQKYRNPMEALRVIRDGTVKYKENMPEMFCYTPNEFKKLLTDAHFEEVTVLGFPVTIHPSKGDEELQQKFTTEKLLKDPIARANLLTLEKQFSMNPAFAYKGGSSLIAVCQKHQSQ